MQGCSGKLGKKPEHERNQVGFWAFEGLEEAEFTRKWGVSLSLLGEGGYNRREVKRQMSDRTRSIVLAVLASGASVALGQDVPTPQKPAEQAVTGGIATLDLLALREGALGAPLRYGAVVPGSEVIDLNGRTLARGREYTLDTATGVVYLKVPYKEGDRLRVSYRREPGKGETGEFGSTLGSSAPSFTLNIAKGANAIVGLGVTERLGEGETYTSQIFGLQNDFALASGLSLRGATFSGERRRAQAVGLLGEQTAGSKLEEGEGRAFVQTLSGNLFGGKIRAYHQDVETRFAGFSSLQAAGFSADEAAKFKREAGLKRSELSLSDIPVGPFALSFADATLDDEKGSITERGYGVKGAGYQAAWSTVKVDESFGRFQDVGGNDWKQLRNEAGSTRDTLNAQANLLGGEAKFSELQVSGGDGQAVEKKSFGFSGSGVKVDWNRQAVAAKFGSFAALRGNEFDLREIRDEAGMIREGLGLQVDRLAGMKLSLDSSSIRSESGAAESLDASAARGAWTFRHSKRSVDAEFNKFGQIGGSAQGMAQGMLGITAETNQATNHDLAALSRSAGLERSSMELVNSPNKDEEIKLRSMSVSDGESGLRLDQFSLRRTGLKFSYRGQRTDDDFSAISKLMPTEQQALGAHAGLKKSDWMLEAEGIELSWMDAADPTGAALRRIARIKRPGLNINFSQRSVGEDFVSVSSLPDPEQKMLHAMVGWTHTEGDMNWSPLANMRVEGQLMSGEREATGEVARLVRGAFQWKVTDATEFKVSQVDRDLSQDGDDLRSEAHFTFALAQRVGSGMLTVGQTQSSFTGTDAQAPDVLTNSVAYETKISERTSIKTEQTESRFSNGDRETVNSNTLQHQITGRTGVSVTDVQVQRQGDDNDRVMRSYGVSHDFGGIKLSYSHVRNLNPGQNDDLRTQVGVSEGQAQGLSFGGSYDRQQWDDRRHRHQGGFTFATVKPVSVGFLENVAFQLRFNSLRDRYSWNQEDKSGRISASLGSSGLSFDYLSQIAPGDERAVDRFYGFQLDRSGKGPLQANLKYGVRSLPKEDHTMVREYSFAFRPAKGFSVEHDLSTNALKAQKNVLLGSVATPMRTNRWALGWEHDANSQVKLFWQESLDDARGHLLRQAGLDFTLFSQSGSPLQLTYAFAQKDLRGESESKHTFGLAFTQKPGPNQSLALQLQNYSWEHVRENNFRDWNLRVDYSVRF